MKMFEESCELVLPNGIGGAVGTSVVWWNCQVDGVVHARPHSVLNPVWIRTPIQQPGTRASSL